MGFLGKTEQKWQLYFGEDNSFKFIKREMAYSCLVIRENGLLKWGWKHFYGSEKYFPGYKRMSTASITLGFARDIILDPFNDIRIGNSVGEKPDLKDKLGLSSWIAKIGTNQRQTYRAKRKSTQKEDIINWSLVGVLLIMTIMWVIKFL